jgi:ATP-dependent helicase/nuclease subunit A
MTVELTDEQRQCVSARGVSVGISAGAGCGKTRVLTERFLAELEEVVAATGPQAWDDSPSPIWEKTAEILQQLVAITFTKRAARELCLRVRTTCEKQIGRTSQSAGIWLGLWRMLDFARIGTIHSFCESLLRKFAVEAGVDPEFRVLDDAAARVMIDQVVEDLLMGKLAKGDDGTLKLAELLGPERLQWAVASLVVDRAKWVNGYWAQATPENIHSKWDEFRQKAVVRAIAELKESVAFQRILEIPRKYPPQHHVLKGRCDTITKLAQTLGFSSASLRKDLTELQEAARIDKVGRSHGWPEDVYKEFRDAAKEVRDRCKNALNLLEIDDATLQDAARLTYELLRLGKEAEELYQIKRQANALLDFTDLVCRAREIFDSPALPEPLQQFARRIRLLMVDEFQDTDRDQEALIRKLCGDQLKTGKLFFVGDYKQSIYGFRGADPEVFRSLRAEVPSAGRLGLTQNFRSQPGILHFVNALFCEALGEDYEPLIPKRPAASQDPVVEFLWTTAEDAATDAGAEDAATRLSTAELRAREAQTIAKRLRRMFDLGERLVLDRERAGPEVPLRPVRPADVVILFRALSDIELYEKALREWGIEYYLVGGQAFYAQQEIYDLANLLKAIANPADAVSLAGTLRSCFFSLEDEVLYWLGIQPSGLVETFYQGPLPGELTRDQQQQVHRARQILCSLRELKDRVSVSELIAKALEWTGFDALLLTEFLGERKLANLRKLIESARNFDRLDALGLEGFIWQLSEYVASQPVEPMAPLVWESADVVRIMTVHQAKGLEFPVVVIADADRSTRGQWEVVRFSREVGPYLTGDFLPGGLRAAFARAEEEENLREMYRLFYVACTRAADYLVLSAGLTSLEKTTGPWMSLLAERFCLRSGACRASLPAGLPQPKVRVFSEPLEMEMPEKAASTKVAVEALLKQFQQSLEQESFPEKSLRYLVAIPPDATARREYSFTALRHAGTDARPLPVLPTPGEVVAMPGGWADLAASEETAESAAPSVDALQLLSAVDEQGSGAAIGLFVHQVLRYLDFRRPESLNHWLRVLSARMGEPPEPLEEIERWIRRFLASPRGQAITRARKVFRETEFLLAWPGETVGRSQPYFRGFFDCLYQTEEGHWIIVDYKTNQVPPDGIESVAETYRLQLELYGLAAERALGAMPLELVLYFLRSGEEWTLNWDAAARQRAVADIEEAIACLRVPRCG